MVSLQDRQNKSMPVRLYCKYCYNQIYNSDVLFLLGLEKEVERLGASSFRFDFTVESEKEIVELFQGKPLRQFTRGHFHKGIE